MTDALVASPSEILTEAAEVTTRDESIDLWNDPGYRYLWSNEAEAFLERLGVEATEAVLAGIQDRYASMFHNRQVKHPMGLAQTMLRRAAWSDDRRRRVRTRTGSRPVVQVDLEHVYGAAGPLISPDPGEQLEQLHARIAYEFNAKRLIASLEAMGDGLTPADADYTRCPLHHRGCPRPENVVAVTQQTANLILNVALDHERPIPDDPRKTRQASNLRSLFVTAATTVDPARYDTSATGRTRITRLWPCVLYRLWIEARSREHEALADAFGRALSTIYMRMLARADHKRARPRLRQWLDEAA